MTFSPEHPPSGTVRNWLDARAAGQATAFVFPEDGSSLSWRELRSEAVRLTWALMDQGIERGESVAIMHPNGRAGLVALFGALYGGFRATMINLAAGPDAIAYALEHCDARIAFVHDDVADLFRDASDGRIARLSVACDPPGAPFYPLKPQDHALLMYTSGTTGRPKGVVHTHASLLAGGWTTAIAHALTSADRGLCVLPFYHINGLCVSVMSAVVSGGSLAVCTRFSARRFWTDAAAAEATWFSVVPTIISHLLHASENPDTATRARLRFGRSASSALAPDVQTAFESRFDVPIVETMGLTETAAQILSNPLPPAVRKIGSPGVPFGNEVCVLDAQQNPCPAGVEGEIAVRGPNVMLEYLKNPQATAESFAGSWLRTGDLGRMDEDGYLFVTGRLKELIIKGGENIAPREIDEALYSHSDVIEAAAFARPCDSYGETVEAAVKLRSGSMLSGDELRQLCEQRLGRFKAPDRVHLLEELPKGPSGKIQRRKLLELIG